MRFVFLGTNTLTLATARMLLDEGFDVVLVEKSKARIDELAEQIDCGFLHGDGSLPDVLEQADPAGTDALFALLNNERDNIIAALVARSLKFKRVILLVTAPEFEHICVELGLEDTVAPNRAVARHLVNMIKGEKSLELSAIIHSDAEVFSFFATECEAGSISELSLPKSTRIICLYRDEKLVLPDETEHIQVDDEIVVIIRSERLPALKKQLEQRSNGNEDDTEAAD
ncbi:potassium channel family protein [Marinobacterium sp. YM272]|uniref:potassium channel family protein n=1 Tax=Marinobacterium sp. YM272 TaxID=3421654 RepID=UPI003D7FF14A